ncbi:MAG: hypothetical protein RR123_02110 [Clostridia bacterium]
MKKFGKIVAVCLVLSMIAVFFVACTPGAKEKSSYVTLEVNPSVEFVTDDKGIVVAINGVNDDGKLIANDEANKSKFIGVEVKVACANFMSFAKDYGFVASGSAEVTADKISISVTSNLPKVAEELYTDIKTNVEAFVNTSGIKATVDKAQAKTRADLEAMAKRANPTLTDVELAAKTNAELIAYAEVLVIEKAQYISVGLEQAYLDFKEYEFEFKDKQKIASTLQGVNEALYNAYNTILVQLDKAIKDLEKLKYDWLVNPNSEYLKLISQIMGLEDNIKVATTKLSKLPAEADRTIAQNLEAGKLMAEIVTYKTALYGIDGTKEAPKEASLVKAIEATTGLMNKAFDGALELLNKIDVKMSELQKSWDKDISTKVTEALVKTEAQINTTKTEICTSFDTKYASDITQIKANVQARKEKLLAK